VKANATSFIDFATVLLSAGATSGPCAFAAPCRRRLLVVLLGLLALPALAQAQFAYETNNGTIALTGYAGPGGAVTIPETINGLPVTSIGGEAFYGYTNMTSIVFAKSITSIGSGAFYGCTSLTSVTLPESLIRMGLAVFGACTSLTSVTLPNSLTSIALEAFSECTSLTSVTLPSGLTTIGGDAFHDCTSLTSIMLPNSLTHIEDWAFNGCGGLTSVTIPKSVTDIGTAAFSSCASLIAITVDTLNPFYSSVDGVLFNKSQTTIMACPAGKAGSFAIPNCVATIQSETFWGCAGLTSITIPKGVSNTGVGAFYGCTNLTSITIPNSVTNLGASAFRNCTSLTSVIVPNSLNSVAEWAFFGCTRLASVTVPNTVTSIGCWAFSGCTSLASVTIPNSVTSIGCEAFADCTSLAGVYFEGNAPAESTGRYDPPFAGCWNATLYYLPGATGWEADYGGRPTALWKPQVQTSPPTFGVQTNRFGFTVSWASDQVVVVEASPDLLSPTWSPIGTNVLAGGSAYFSDPQGMNYPRRFYRVRAP
jgi:BspA type Leucine rich repeat region (6 copies)